MLVAGSTPNPALYRPGSWLALAICPRDWNSPQILVPAAGVQTAFFKTCRGVTTLGASAPARQPGIILYLCDFQGITELSVPSSIKSNSNVRDKAVASSHFNSHLYRLQHRAPHARGLGNVRSCPDFPFPTSDGRCGLDLSALLPPIPLLAYRLGPVGTCALGMHRTCWGSPRGCGTLPSFKNAKVVSSPMR